MSHTHTAERIRHILNVFFDTTSKETTDRVIQSMADAISTSSRWIDIDQRHRNPSHIRRLVWGICVGARFLPHGPRRSRAKLPFSPTEHQALAWFRDVDSQEARDGWERWGKPDLVFFAHLFARPVTDPLLVKWYKHYTSPPEGLT